MIPEDPTMFDQRVEELTRVVDASSDLEVRAAAKELVSLVLQFHRAGLRRILDILDDAPDTVHQRLAGDPIITALLALHELESSAATVPGSAQGSRSGPVLLQIRRAIDTPSLAASLHAQSSACCERCGAALDQSHRHFVDIGTRRLFCSCRACWLLSQSGTAGRSLRAVPDRYVAEPSFSVTAAQWEALQLPVGIVFFLFNSSIGRTIAFYPSPAGATESALPLAAWRDVEQSNPRLRAAVPDVEAILVRKDGRETEKCEAFIVPIDACYDLVGRIRMHWTGFDGGDVVRAEVERFFGEVAARSTGAESVQAYR
jgi:hypothetical protein